MARKNGKKKWQEKLAKKDCKKKRKKQETCRGALAGGRERPPVLPTGVTFPGAKGAFFLRFFRANEKNARPP